MRVKSSPQSYPDILLYRYASYLPDSDIFEIHTHCPHFGSRTAAARPVRTQSTVIPVLLRSAGSTSLRSLSILENASSRSTSRIFGIAACSAAYKALQIQPAVPRISGSVPLLRNHALPCHRPHSSSHFHLHLLLVSYILKVR